MLRLLCDECIMNESTDRREVKKPEEEGYRRTSEKTPDYPGRTWADFTNNFLFNFFEGQSFTIWLFVSALLFFLFGHFLPEITNSLLNLSFHVSFFLLFLLVFTTLVKNLIYSNPFGLSYKLSLPRRFSYNKWVARVTTFKPRKLSLPVRASNFRRICSKVLVIDSGNGRWRAGYWFVSSITKREYIFHAFQDEGSDLFHSRIVEREPGVAEMEPDVQKNNIGIENSKEFELLVESKKDGFYFYIDGIYSGKYTVPIEKITDVIIAAWSDDKPITVIFEDIHVWF